MKTVTRQACQGDVMFRRIEALPKGVVERKEAGTIVVCHSETGHHHSIGEGEARLFDKLERDPMLCYLAVAEHADVVHLRDYDTHETLRLTPGFYEVRRQEEYTPEGWRRVCD